jgi:hypothetical protein
MRNDYQHLNTTPQDRNMKRTERINERDELGEGSI